MTRGQDLPSNTTLRAVFAAILLVLSPAGSRAIEITAGSVLVETSPDDIVYTTVTPAFPAGVTVGDYIRITFTLENTSGLLGNLCTDLGGGTAPAPNTFSSCAFPDPCNFGEEEMYGSPSGQYWVWPYMGAMPCPNDINSTPVSVIQADAVVNFFYNGWTYAAGAPNESQVVTWKYKAERETGGLPLDFQVFAFRDDEWSFCPCCFLGMYTEGTYFDCGTVSPYGDGTLATILTDYWGGNIEIKSPIANSTTVYNTDPGTRPDAVFPLYKVAYLEDNFLVETSVTNNGAAVWVNACAAVRNTSSLCVLNTPPSINCTTPNSYPGFSGLPAGWADAGTPALPYSLANGAAENFRWTYSVKGANAYGPFLACSTGGTLAGATVFWDVNVGGAVSITASYYVEPAPLAITTTVWLDPDGSAGPAPAYPLDKGATLYYMGDETVEVRATISNLGPYELEVHPDSLAEININSALGPDYKLVAPFPPTVYLLGYGATTATFYFERDPADHLGQFCEPGQGFDIYVAERGVGAATRVFTNSTPFGNVNCSLNRRLTTEERSINAGGVLKVWLELRNEDTRQFTIASLADIAGSLQINAFDGASSTVMTYPTVTAPVTWNGGETKTFEWIISAGPGVGTIFLESKLMWNGNPCLTACCASGPKTNCNSAVTAELAVVKPSVLSSCGFTATPPLSAFEGDKNVRLELCLQNTSTVCGVQLQKYNGPVAYRIDGSPGGGSMSGASTSTPYTIPMSSSIYISWGMSIGCGTYYYASQLGSLIEARDLCDNSLIELDPASNQVSVVQPAILRCGIFPEALEYSVGQTIRIYFTVSNAGQRDAFLAGVTMYVDSLYGGAVTLAGTSGQCMSGCLIRGSPSMCWDPPPPDGGGAFGDTETYWFDFLAVNQGKLIFTGSVTGDEPISGTEHVCSGKTPIIKIASESILSASATADGLVTMAVTAGSTVPVSSCGGSGAGCIQAVLTVANVGEMSVTDFSVSLPQMLPCDVPCGATLALYSAMISEPDPIRVIPYMGQSSYTWVYDPAGLGCIRFRLAGMGVDSATREARPVQELTNCVSVLSRAPVELRLVDAPRIVMRGQEFEVTVEVYNPGGTPVILQGGEPALVFMQAATGSAMTENFEVLLPSPVPVAVGERKMVKARVKVLPAAPLGAAEIRVPRGTMFIARDGATGGPVSVVDAGSALVLQVLGKEFSLQLRETDPNSSRPYRNPFILKKDVLTWLKFNTGENGRVKLKLYTITGELVRILVDEHRPVGHYEEPWDGRNEGGQYVASGIYLVRFEAPNFSVVRKLALVK